MSKLSAQELYRGCFVGLAIGDALGMPLEFKEPHEFEPLASLEKGGPFNLPLGYWTDDTSMALCLADSLLAKVGYDSYDVMDRYCAWRNDGYRSSLGVCFDIGNQVSTSLNEYQRDGAAIIRQSKDRLSSAGNGSIMRLAPIIIASHSAGNSIEKTMELAKVSGRETHYSLLAEEGAALFGGMIYNSIEQKSKNKLLDFGSYKTSDAFNEILEVVKSAQTRTTATLDPTGYIINSLECAMWAFMNNETFKAGALEAVNLGGDADTIGAIYGQLAGAFYGYGAIPLEWRKQLYLEEDIASLSNKLASMESCEIRRTRFEEDSEQYATKYELTSVNMDITKIEADAIVNAANTSLFGGSGVCGAIFDAAGYDKMTAACQAIGRCEYGDAVVTPGFSLPAQWVIHTVGPVYGQHNGDEAAILQSCYWQSLRIAQNKRLRTVVFPLISTGIYSYPKEDAVVIAIKSIKEFFEDNPQTSIEKVILCAYSDEDKTILDKSLE